MTCREKLKIEHPDKVGEWFGGGCCGCPVDYGYLDAPDGCNGQAHEDECRDCWDREVPKTALAPQIKDSGDRRQFSTGAVRDIQDGKGRCDLMPLDVLTTLKMGAMTDDIMHYLSEFQITGQYENLIEVLNCASYMWRGESTQSRTADMLLEVSKHFEEGHKKYPPNADGVANWKLGIPAHSYIDSAVRHYLKWLRGDDDERHDRAFCWNIMCCIWTCHHKPELNDYPFVKNDNNKDEE